MRTRKAARLAWVNFSLTVGLSAAGVFLVPLDAPHWSDVLVVGVFVVFVIAFSAVGALLVRARPRNPIGWILSVAAFCYAVGSVSLAYVAYRVDLGNDPLPGGAMLASLSSWVWGLGLGLAGTFLLLLFPDGRLPPGRWRALGWPSAVALVMFVVGSVIDPGRVGGVPERNPLGIEGAAGAADLLSSLGIVLLLASILGSVATLFVRFRRSDRAQRQQLKWLLYAGAIVVAGIVASTLIEALGARGEATSNLANSAATLGIASIPVTIGVAILRHRLYDIDLIINRTLVYGSLTAILGTGYAAAVAGISTFADESDLTVAAATLAVAALFQPLRRRVQSLIDQRFYRSKYDAARTLEAFGTHLRDEVDLESLSGELVTVVQETMHPSQVSLWLRTPKAGER